MSNFRGVCLKGEEGEKFFVLRNGRKTKTFYDAGEFNFAIGQFPIYDKDGQIVEYMDLMGTFSKENTDVACEIYCYLVRDYIPRMGAFYECGIEMFPSKYLTDLKVREFIKNEEDKRYRFACQSKSFTSIIDRLWYKHYISQWWKLKIKRANRMIKQRENAKIETNQNKEI